MIAVKILASVLRIMLQDGESTIDVRIMAILNFIKDEMNNLLCLI